MSLLGTKKVSGTLHLVQETWRPRKPKVPDTFFVLHTGSYAADRPVYDNLPPDKILLKRLWRRV